MAASVNSLTPQKFLLPNSSKPIKKELKPSKVNFPLKGVSKKSTFLRTNSRKWIIGSITEELDVIPVQSNDLIDQQEGVLVRIELERDEEQSGLQVGGFANEGRFSFEGAGELNGFSSSSSPSSLGGVVSEVIGNEEEDIEMLIDRAINATIVLAAGIFAITKLLTIDRDYWHGWTIFEILRYAPLHNWAAYEEALKENPVLAKMVISGVVYSLGDWIAQCCEGKPLFDFDRTRMFRSGLVGFSLHGSLSHYYYQFCEALFPFQDWWVVPVKVVFDQTVWAALWNSIYYVLLGLLRFESPVSIFSELKATFIPMLTAGWKLWPFAHLITYGVVPVEQRLLWVDCVELIWVTILSTLSNEKSEARTSEVSLEVNSSTQSIGSEE
ncbi:Peroxisomal membrane (Mpv17/PMP22) family protein [Thalictrum thalictroides]|uniref:Peroxisomal membrane (Mpv17/PMP22) family protein n=1 Tax=Thalictrum thalictroides TaxID=46969 RepID=A0A7J6XC84_THATH|nr:Peroxisomal membrane (Mpv17/PMP22) family protein [Thalictrum thalictroides]